MNTIVKFAVAGLAIWGIWKIAKNMSKKPTATKPTENPLASGQVGRPINPNMDVPVSEHVSMDAGGAELKGFVNASGVSTFIKGGGASSAKTKPFQGKVDKNGNKLCFDPVNQVYVRCGTSNA